MADLKRRSMVGLLLHAVDWLFFQKLWRLSRWGEGLETLDLMRAITVSASSSDPGNRVSTS